MSFLDRVYQRAKEMRARVVFPEGDDPRVQEAAARRFSPSICAPAVPTGFPPMQPPPRRSSIRSRAAPVWWASAPPT